MLSYQLKLIHLVCGNGWFLEICKNNSIECIGIEPDTRYIEKYQRADLNVKNGFFPKDISNNIKYDFIIYNDVLSVLTVSSYLNKATVI